MVLVFVFDVDNTLMTHSGGYAEVEDMASYWKNDPANAVRMFDMFRSIRSKGHLVYLHSRGMESGIVEVFTAALRWIGSDQPLGVFINEIFAVKGEPEIDDPFLAEDGETRDDEASRRALYAVRDMMEPEVALAWFGGPEKEAARIKDGYVMWAVKKTLILHQITTQLGIGKMDLLFYDDTPDNINTAKRAGFRNSFIATAYDQDETSRTLFDLVMQHVEEADRRAAST